MSAPSLAGRLDRRRVNARLTPDAAAPSPTTGGPGPGRRARGRRPPTWFRARIEAFALPVDADVVWRRGGLAVAALLAASAVVGGAALAATVVVVMLVLLAMGTDLCRGRADRLVERALPAFLDRLASGLRSGLSVPAALAEGASASTGPLAGDLAIVVAGLGAGLPLATCLARWRRRRPVDGVSLVTAALALSFDLGGSSRPLDGVASTLRDRLAVDGEVRAGSAQAWASALALVALPWGFLALAGAQDPGLFGFFVDGPVGVGCLLGGVLLDAGGSWLILRAVRGAR